ncbi:MAG: phosphate acyltransferase PlsX [Bacilli bacterium]
MKIVIDMMGGDYGLKTTVPSLKEFISKHKDVFIYAIGDSSLVNEMKDMERVKIVLSKTVLRMDIDPMSALRDNESSLMIAVKTFIDEKCDFIISAGSTGALLSASVMKIKRIPGITRPGLISIFPSYKDNKRFVCCDLGANNANTAEELNQFATMGSLFYSFLYDNNNPKVYLLSNGTEEEKGSVVGKDAFQLMKANKKIQFCGNMEARDPLFGECDVLVTDGFSGNIFLKTMEGTAKVMGKMMKDAFSRNIFTKLSYLVCKKGIKSMKEKMDYKNVGGAMLLGVNGIVLKAHGASDTQAFTHSLDLGYLLAKKDIITKFKENISAK